MPPKKKVATEEVAPRKQLATKCARKSALSKAQWHAGTEREPGPRTARFRRFVAEGNAPARTRKQPDGSWHASGNMYGYHHDWSHIPSLDDTRGPRFGGLRCAGYFDPRYIAYRVNRLGPHRPDIDMESEKELHRKLFTEDLETSTKSKLPTQSEIDAELKRGRKAHAAAEKALAEANARLAGPAAALEHARAAVKRAHKAFEAAASKHGPLKEAADVAAITFEITQRRLMQLDAWDCDSAQRRRCDCCRDGWDPVTVSDQGSAHMCEGCRRLFCKDCFLAWTDQHCDWCEHVWKDNRIPEGKAYYRPGKSWQWQREFNHSDEDICSEDVSDTDEEGKERERESEREYEEREKRESEAGFCALCASVYAGEESERNKRRR